MCKELPNINSKSNLPFNQFNSDKIIAISRVEEYKAIWGGCLELEEEVHGCVGLQSGQAQIAALGFEGDGVGDNGTNPKAGIELAIINVTILAQVDVEHTVKSEERKEQAFETTVVKIVLVLQSLEKRDVSQR